MNYSDMSDFEINKAVGKFFPELVIYNGDGKPVTLVSDPGATYTGVDFEEVEFDPCNSWSDAGPIIMGNKICLSCYPNRNDWDAFTLSDKGYAEETTYDANPLRAAMIVFLMMKEV